MELQRRPTARLAYNLDLAPVHAETNAGAESFGSSLFGGEARCEAFGGVALAQTVGLFGLGVDAVKKTHTEAVHRVLDALNLDKVNSCAYDHSYKVQQTGSRARLQLL